MKTCTAAYSSSDAAVGKQRQTWSSILLYPHLFSQIPPPLLSCTPASLVLSLFISLISIRISVCLMQFLPGFPGAQVRPGSVSICMEICYSPGIHWGHTSITAAHVRTYWGSAGGGVVCVFIYAESNQRKKKKQEDIYAAWSEWKTGKSIAGLIPSHIRQRLLNV